MQTIRSHYQLDLSVKTVKHFELDLYVLKDLDLTFDQFSEKFGDEALKNSLIPYFGKLWESSIELTRMLSSDSNINFKNKKVLELGCGIALPSFYATKHGAKVLALDIHPDVKHFLEINQKQNNLFFDYAEFDWSNSLEIEDEFDYVFISDCLYEESFSDKLVGLLNQNIHGKTKLFIADPGRKYLESFVDKMNLSRFKLLNRKLINTIHLFEFQKL